MVVLLLRPKPRIFVVQAIHSSHQKFHREGKQNYIIEESVLFYCLINTGGSLTTNAALLKAVPVHSELRRSGL